jgi:hypothetical protein
MALTTFVAGNVLTAAQLNDSFAAIGGLRLIKKQTIGSAVSTVTLSNVFSADYDNYRIIINVEAGSASSNMRLTVGAANTAYYAAAYGLSYSTGASTTTQSNAAYWDVAIINTSGGNTVIDLLDPFNTDQTCISFTYAELLTTGVFRTGAGYLNNTTSYTDFTFVPQTGTYTGGTVYVYGYGITV